MSANFYSDNEKIINDYLSSGLSVIPITMPSKRPTKPWKEYQEKIIDKNELKNDLVNLNGSGGVAIVCGAVSGNLEVMDFDNKFDLAKKTFNEFYKIDEVKKIIDSYSLPIEKTFSKGYHLFYRCSKIERNLKLAQITKNNKTETIIETRGEGGYIIVDPTPEYQILKGQIHNIPVISEEDRKTLINYARGFGEHKLSHNWKEIKSKNKSQSYEIPSETIKNLLTESGWTYAGSNGINDHYRRPGKKFGNSADYDGSVFYVYSSNCPPFENEKGYNNFQVFTLLKHQGDPRSAESDLLDQGIISEKDIESSFFVYEINGKMVVNYYDFLKFLDKKKIYRFDRENDYIFVQVVNDKIVKRINIPIIKDLVSDHVEKNKSKEEVRAIIHTLFKYENSLFTEKKLAALKKFTGNFSRDNKNEAFLYYKDAFVKITSNNFEALPYEKLCGFIWESQIIERNILGFDKSLENEAGDFKLFLQKVTNFDNTDESKNDRYLSLITALGYVLHKYKNPALTKAVILCDEGSLKNIDHDFDSSQGGTGKSLICNAISKIRSTAFLPGKNLDFKKSFVWQSVNEDTEIIWIDDISKKFEIENIFPYITGDFGIEQKNKQSFTIPFDKSPKFIIPTNFTIEDSDVSTKRRIHEIELAPIYDENHTPLDDFKKRFFDDWDEKEWYYFDSFMCNCISIYLQNGLIDYKKINLKTRKFYQTVPAEFLEWIEPHLNNYPVDFEGWIDVGFVPLYNNFKVDQSGSKWISQTKITRWFIKYLEFNNYNFEKRKINRANGVRIHFKVDISTLPF